MLDLICCILLLYLSSDIKTFVDLRSGLLQIGGLNSICIATISYHFIHVDIIRYIYIYKSDIV